LRIKSELRGELFEFNESFVGYIHSVFFKAVNILHKDIYISLLENKELLSPYSLVVPELFQGEKTLLGKNVYLDKGFVKIENVCQIKLPKESKRGSLNRVQLKKELDLKSLKIFIEQKGEKEGFYGVVCSDSISIWAKKAKNIIKNEFSIDCNKLVGLGVGFTPSGDDFITGVLIALDFLKREDEFQKLANTLDLSKTNLGGRTLLKGAVKRKYPDIFIKFMDSLAQGKILKEVVNFGSTSGTDFICGLYWTLKNKNKG